MSAPAKNMLAATSLRRKKKTKDDEDATTAAAGRNARKTVKRRLATGQTVALSPQDDKTLRAAYEFCAGYVKRMQLTAQLEAKRAVFAAAAEAGGFPNEFRYDEADRLANKSRRTARTHQQHKHRRRKQQQRQGDDSTHASIVSSGNTGEPAHDVDDAMSTHSGVSDSRSAVVGGRDVGDDDDDDDDLTDDSRHGGGGGGGGDPGRELTAAEQLEATYKRATRELRKLHDRLDSHLADCERTKISLRDLDAILKRFGVVNMPKKQLEQMVWEVDEDMDGCVSWDEFQLTFCRNVDTTSASHASEPHAFFRVIEFLTFDEARKGYCLEDDVMEVLFSRYGSYRLEKELQFLFGPSLRALGGDGTLYLDRYLQVLQERSGRRALIVP